RVFERIDARDQDESFASFLARRPGGRALERDRAAARAFVQGFHAADVERISVRSIAPRGGEPPNEAVSQSGRIVEGHDRLCDWIARDVEDAVRLRAVVTEIAWTRRRVDVRFEDDSPAAEGVRAQLAC